MSRRPNVGFVCELRHRMSKHLKYMRFQIGIVSGGWILYLISTFQYKVFHLPMQGQAERGHRPKPILLS